jgi:ATP-binding cassette subfamily B protein
MTSLIRLRPYLRRHRGALLVAVVCVICANGIGLLGPLVLQRAIDSLGRHGNGPALWQYALLLILVALVNNGFNFGMRWSINSTSQRIEYELRNDLFRHFQRLELAFFQSSKVGDLVARATNDLSTVRRMLGPGISSLMNTTVAFTITMAAMAILDLRLTLISGVFLPLMTVIFVMLGRRIERAYRRVQDQFGDLSARAQENFSGIRVVKAYVQEDHEVAAFGRLNWQYVTRSMHYARLTGGLWPAMTLVGGLSVAMLLWVGGNDVIAHRLSLGEFVQFNAYLGQLAWPMISLGWSFNLFQQGDASLNRIREVTERPPEIADRPHPAAARRFDGAIEFQHVSLSYEGHEVLHDISLRIPAGATVAVVGPTGAGKTSLLNLLPRVFDATSGRVTVDGVDVREWPLETLRRQIGYVTQETFLFSVPLSENVAYGVAEATPAQVEAAATIAQLARDVADFPQGYATTIGERGVTLSGGQKQRTAIARAVIKNPRILLLDDALSSVDTHTEEEILRGLREIVEGRTSLIVSHRISTVRDADTIVVLDEGRIVEQGTHEQLVVHGGLYASMYRRQLLSEELDVEIEEEL